VTENRTRERNFRVWLSEDELKLLAEKAKSFNMSKSEYVRSVIKFGSAGRSHTNLSKEESERLRYEVNRIGNNINQVAYRVNGKGTVDIEDFEKLRIEFVEYLNLLSDYALV